MKPERTEIATKATKVGSVSGRDNFSATDTGIPLATTVTAGHVFGATRFSSEFPSPVMAMAWMRYVALELGRGSVSHGSRDVPFATLPGL